MLYTFLGVWNSVDNSPALVNGVGVTGSAYIIQSGSGFIFNRDLGAGPVSWFSGKYIVYNGSAWIQF